MFNSFCPAISRGGNWNQNIPQESTQKQCNKVDVGVSHEEEGNGDLDLFILCGRLLGLPYPVLVKDSGLLTCRSLLPRPLVCKSP